jgi:hypothetical protein
MARLTGLFPPGKGGGEDVAYGYKGNIGHKLRLPNICQESGLGSVKLIADKL